MNTWVTRPKAFELPKLKGFYWVKPKEQVEFLAYFDLDKFIVANTMIDRELEPVTYSTNAIEAWAKLEEPEWNNGN